MPFFSVIIPVYQAQFTLSETLESLVKQQFRDFEVIVVNDGSTDTSMEMVSEFESKLPAIKVVEQENKGLGAARNAGAGIAEGKWLAFLDADDFCASSKLAEMYLIANRLPAVKFMYHAIYERYASGRLRRRNFWTIKTIADLIEKGNSIVPSASAIETAFFRDLGGFSENREEVEDLLLWIKILKSQTAIYANPKPLAVYRLGYGVTGDLEGHLSKVIATLSRAVTEGFISPGEMQSMMKRKNYEMGRQLYKLGKYCEAVHYFRLSQLNDRKTNLFKMLSGLMCKLKNS